MKIDAAPQEVAWPSDWQIMRFSEVATYQLGRTPPRRSANYWAESGGFPWVTIADMKPFATLSSTAEMVSEGATVEVFQAPPVPRGTLLMSFKLTIGRTAVLEIDAYHNAAIISIFPKSGIDRDFLRFYLPTINFGRYQDRAVKGQTLNRAKIDTLPIPVPPLPEQQTIVAILSRLHLAVDLQERIVATLKELKASTMAKLFREGLRGEPLKQTEIGEIPESWGMTPLGQLCREPDGFIQTGPFGSQLHASDYLEEGIPIVNPTHMDAGRIQHAEIPRISARGAERLQRHKLRVGDVLFSRRGDVGRHAHVFVEEEGWLCGTGCLIVRPSRDGVHPLYLSYFLDTQSAQEFLNAHAVGSIMPNINTRILVDVPIAIPSRKDQLEVATLCDSLDTRIRCATSRLEALRGVFSTMLQLLMTGEVRVPLEGQVGRRAAGKPGQSSLGDVGVGASNKLPETVERFVAELVRRFEPERVILFGSHADGSATPDSDLDLLVVMGFEGGSSEQAARMDSMLERSFPLDLLVRRPEAIARAVARGDVFVTGILERGRALYVRPGSADLRETAPRQERPPHRGTLGEETLREIVQRIVETVHPEKIILFGSAARGEMGPDSDVDLLVVKSGVHRRELAARLYRELADLPVPKDIVVATPEDLERHRDTIGLVYRAALRDGRVVYDAA